MQQTQLPHFISGLNGSRMDSHQQQHLFLLRPPGTIQRPSSLAESEAFLRCTTSTCRNGSVSHPTTRSVGTSGGSGRVSHSDASSIHTYPGRVRATEGSPTARTYPSTPRHQVKHTACSDNHGIRPPTPEQYLTPLQQKEVCIRHLRARLRENVERLQHRDCEIDELRNQLYRMQEDWIEEECHRVEAQLALKEARKEIQHLQEVVESVRSNLAVREQDPHDHKPYSGLQGARPGGRSRSCGCSPASTLSRSTTYHQMSTEALQLEHSSNAPEVSGASRATGQTHLLLDAALLSEQLPPQGHIRCPRSMPRSSTYERLCSGGAVLPISHSCHTLSSSCRCSGHTHLPHHHLFLHLPQEEALVTAESPAVPVTDPVPIPATAEKKKPEVRSQACSPTMTWLCEESGTEELSVISLAADPTPSEPQQFPSSLPIAFPSENSHSVEPLPHDKSSEETKMPTEPYTRQPHPMAPLPVRQEATVVEINDDNKDETEAANEDGYSPQRCHWSRYFLVDLLALTMPVVPTMAWLCRGAQQEVMPVYHIGSLLRGCCAVALHSLRRQGRGRGRRPTSMNGATPI
ncbi:Syntabulin Golgi-localized syntaphilin-related protein [Channa argus]|uniref:Syntabulin Golgi-localized syntaphilin-related protein n=1 Tax=Channa argus TaxID=215402 RepID=A0A6G1Q3W8_CHAAH|nr:Syntabulin Golgi-localized syntaphilin-related protein [Channa argus]